MTFSVDVDVRQRFAVAAPYEEAIALLCDIPASAALFPQLERLVELGDGKYRWDMGRLGPPQSPMQTVYACRYAVDRDRGRVTWEPVTGVGNARIGGHWTATAGPSSTALDFRVQGTIDVPLPGLMRMMIAPMVDMEFARLVRIYLDNVAGRLRGKVT